MTPEGPGTQTGSVARRLLDKLGPGLVTGASDDDPSGIATYSQVGAQFGYGLLWTILLSYPLMAAIQEISARIGRVTGCGIAANLRKTCPKPLLYAVLAAMAGANVFNLGADIGAMAQLRSCSLQFTCGTEAVEGCRQSTVSWYDAALLLRMLTGYLFADIP